MELKGKTLKDTVVFEGVGIHTGEICKIKVHPSDGGEILFCKKGIEIPAFHPFVVNTYLGTDLGAEGEVIKTVEHLMAAFYLLGINSAVVEVERGNEVPILDGGAKTFVENFLEVGLSESGKDWRVLKIGERFRIQPNGNFVEVEPFEGELLIYEGIFPYVGRRRVVYDGKMTDALVGARTFCRLEDVELLRKNGFGLGGYLVNTLVLNKNLDYLVYGDEPAYHKLLDLIGDLALLGAKIEGKIYTFKGNHTLNHQLREYLLKTYGVEKGKIKLQEVKVF